jgi:hypothetical protein
VQVISTSSFREAKKLLTKRRENGYSSCPKDICDALKDLDFDSIFNLHFLVREIGEVRVIKLRLKNSDQNLSSAQGFRLIILCNKRYRHVALLKIYPKRGKYSKSDLTKHEYKELLTIYRNELKDGSVKELDVKNELVEIKS